MNDSSGSRRFWSRLIPATQHDLRQSIQAIMSAIATYAEKVNASFDKIATAVTGIADDVTFLKEEIAKLQNTNGPISPEDQAILDGLEARTATLTTNLETLNAATSRPPTP